MTDSQIGRRLRRAGLLVGSAVVLASCGTDNGQNSLDPKGPAAEKIDNLFIPILILAIVIGIAVVVATVVFALKFRHREGQPDNPKQIHGSTPLEIGWTIVPALILAVVAVPTVATIFDLAKEPKGPEVLQVTVSGKQWWWEFELPKQAMVDQKIVTSTELHIPVNTKVFLKQKSDNVIHSFWVPELAGKKDVMPGRTNTNTIEASEEGTFLGACAEYCGLAHADMRFRVIATSMDGVEGVGRGPAGGSGPAVDGGDQGAHRHEVPVHELPHLRRLDQGRLRAEPHPLRQPQHVRRRRLRAHE